MELAHRICKLNEFAGFFHKMSAFPCKNVLYLTEALSVGVIENEAVWTDMDVASGGVI